MCMKGTTMALLSDYKAKLHMAFDRQLPVEARAFAALECLFQPRNPLAMDVKEFHGMVNDVAAQHLGAIQVLGYLLGALAGGLLLLARF